MDPVRRNLATLIAASGVGPLLAGCSSLKALNVLNALTPGDWGARKLVDGAPYGPDARQKLDVYAPARAAPNAPVIVFFYGGSWSSGDRGGYAFVGEALAAQGFVVVIPDYRLVPQVVFPAFVQDGAAAIRWTRDTISRYGGDPRRMGLSGHSAGAYISAMLALDETWLRQVGVQPQIVQVVANLAGPYDFYPFDVAASQDAFGSYRDPRATQPINFVRKDAPPAFLAFGDKDTTVKPRNSIALAGALRQAGVTVELKAYPDLDHISILLALSKPFRGKAPVLKDMADFLTTHLA